MSRRAERISKPMTPERYAKIEEIFQAALDCPPADRAAFVEERCGGDADLRFEIEKLLRVHDTDNAFLESPIWTDSRIFQTTLKNKVASYLEENSVRLKRAISSPGKPSAFTGSSKPQPNSVLGRGAVAF